MNKRRFSLLFIILFNVLFSFGQPNKNRPEFLSLDDILNIQMTPLSKVTDFFRLKKWQFYSSVSEDESYSNLFYDLPYEKVQWTYNVSHYYSEDRAMGWASYHYGEGLPTVFVFQTALLDDFNTLLNEAKRRFKQISTEVPSENELLTKFKTPKGLEIWFSISKDESERGKYYKMIRVIDIDGIKKKWQEYLQHLENFLRTQNIQSVIDAFASNDRHQIVELVHYPYDMGLLPAIKNKSEMLQRFDEVFDDYLVKLIANSAVSDWKEDDYYGGISLFNNSYDRINLYEFDEKLKIKMSSFSTPIYLSKEKEIIERERNSLHESIRNFSHPVFVGTTKKQRIRIDYTKTDSLSYRLCVWDKNSKWDEAPDIILAGEADDSRSYQFGIFKSDNTVYVAVVGGLACEGYVLYTFESNDFTDVTSVYDDKYKSAEDIEKYTREKIISEIERIEQLKKQQEYIQTASQKFRDGELSQAKLWYEKALKIEHSNGIAESLKQVNEEIQRVNDLKKTLAQRHIYVSNNHSLLENPQIVSQLPTIKKGYDVTYRTCVEYINKILKDEWETVESGYNDNLPLSQKREIWIDEDQKILDTINEFSLKVESYKKFNDKISELIANNDKKTLKIFKEKFSPVVVAYLMAL